MRIAHRKLLLVTLVMMFAIQTWFVYSDTAGRRTPPLSPLAADGCELWHQYNCQSCHQIYGFGGFLGPDLTNAIRRLNPDRLDRVLTDGIGQMPAFQFNTQERGAVIQFLRELDATGVGQARAADTPEPAALLRRCVEKIAAESPLSSLQQRGFDLTLQKGCIDCHHPHAAGRYPAPEITLLAVTPGREGVLFTMLDGRPARGMPAFHLPLEEREAVADFLEWLHAHAPAVREAFPAPAAKTGGASTRMPWFEFQ